MELKRVVVTGLGAVTPVGLNVEETWNNLVNGVSGAAPITHFDCSKFKTQFACEVKNLNVADLPAILKSGKFMARKIDGDFELINKLKENLTRN